MKQLSNKALYDIEYRKRNKKQICLDLNLNEYNELKELIESTGISKIDVFRKGLEVLKREVTKK